MNNQIVRQGGAYSYIQDVDLDIVRDITQVDTDLSWDECFTKDGYDNGGYLTLLKDDRIKILSGFLPLLIPGYTHPKISLNDYTLNPILRDNQRQAIEVALDKTRGIIKMPTGIGKALVAVELCRIFLESGHRSVICVATRALLYQMKDELIKYGVDEKYIGLVGDGNKECDKPVVVGISDSLAIGSNYDGTFLGEARLLIFDESHLYQNITSLLINHYMKNARYRIGLSATPFIKNGMENILIGICGPIIYQCSEEDAIEQGFIMKPKVIMYEAPSSYAPPALLSRPYSHYVYNILYRHLILKNNGRNKLIAKLSADYMDKGIAPLIIIVSKVNTKPNHPEMLLPYLSDLGYDLPVISGTTPKKILTQVIDGLRSFSIPGAIFGPGVMKEGVNISNLGCVVLAGAGSSDVALIQRVGRALRYVEGKEQPIIIDFKDKRSFFANQSIKRLDTYKSTYGMDSVEIISMRED